MDNIGTILNILAVLQGGTLIAIVTYGYKVIRFFNSIEFKTDLMWKDYNSRIQNSGFHRHRRDTDMNETSEE